MPNQALQQTAAARRAFYRSSLSSGGLSILLGLRFDAKRAAELGLVTRVVPDQELLASATATARELAARAPAALQACKRLMRSSTRDELERLKDMPGLATHWQERARKWLQAVQQP